MATAWRLVDAASGSNVEATYTHVSSVTFDSANKPNTASHQVKHPSVFCKNAVGEVFVPDITAMPDDVYSKIVATITRSPTLLTVPAPIILQLITRGAMNAKLAHTAFMAKIGLRPGNMRFSKKEASDWAQAVRTAYPAEGPHYDKCESVAVSDLKNLLILPVVASASSSRGVPNSTASAGVCKGTLIIPPSVMSICFAVVIAMATLFAYSALFDMHYTMGTSTEGISEYASTQDHANVLYAKNDVNLYVFSPTYYTEGWHLQPEVHRNGVMWKNFSGVSFRSGEYLINAGVLEPHTIALWQSNFATKTDAEKLSYLKWSARGSMCVDDKHGVGNICVLVNSKVPSAIHVCNVVSVMIHPFATAAFSFLTKMAAIFGVPDMQGGSKKTAAKSGSEDQQKEGIAMLVSWVTSMFGTSMLSSFCADFVAVPVGVDVWLRQQENLSYWLIHPSATVVVCVLGFYCFVIFNMSGDTGVALFCDMSADTMFKTLSGRWHHDYYTKGQAPANVTMSQVCARRIVASVNVLLVMYQVVFGDAWVMYRLVLNGVGVAICLPAGVVVIAALRSGLNSVAPKVHSGVNIMLTLGGIMAVARDWAKCIGYSVACAVSQGCYALVSSQVSLDIAYDVYFSMNYISMMWTAFLGVHVGLDACVRVLVCLFSLALGGRLKSEVEFGVNLFVVGMCFGACRHIDRKYKIAVPGIHPVKYCNKLSLTAYVVAATVTACRFAVTVHYDSDMRHAWTYVVYSMFFRGCVMNSGVYETIVLAMAVHIPWFEEWIAS